MKIVHGYPPIYAKIKKVFPQVEQMNNIVFCFGDKIYSPSSTEVEDHIIVHESVHSRQQGDKIEEWWDRYLKDPEFRLEQEIEAYGEQYAYAIPLLNAQGQQIFLETIASDLAGSMYGFIISQPEAESKIRNYAKSVLAVKDVV